MSWLLLYTTVLYPIWLPHVLYTCSLSYFIVPVINSGSLSYIIVPYLISVATVLYLCSLYYIIVSYRTSLFPFSYNCLLSYVIALILYHCPLLYNHIPCIMLKFFLIYSISFLISLSEFHISAQSPITFDPILYHCTWSYIIGSCHISFVPILYHYIIVPFLKSFSRILYPDVLYTRPQIIP